ncbi:MAG TPA: ATP-binding protein [Streptosporangiaceae bacterium]|nr:ATP-binding protein [Streptosporangiaceae bacterium]
MRTRVTHTGEPTADVRFCLLFPREALSVPVMRRVLGDTLGRLGVDDGSISDLLLAVTEACTNVLRHSGQGRGYEIVARVFGNSCQLEVIDRGRGFDPAALPRRPVVRRPVHPVAVLHRRHRTLPAPTSLTLRRRIGRPRRLTRRRSVAQLPESGRGLAIMRACVDDVTLSSGPGQGTVVMLHKRIAWRSDAPSAMVPQPRLRDAG